MTKEEVIICKMYLEDLDTTNHTCNEYKLLMQLLEQEPCEDAVSRQAALGALNCEISGSIESDIDLSKYKREFQEFANMILNAQEKAIQALPSVTPTRKELIQIPVSEELPKCEQKVLVLVLSRDNTYTITTGMYEDGSMSECDSCWTWEDVDFEKWDDENDCGIIPEGWYEYHEFNPDGVLNYAIYGKVVAWMSLPEPYGEREGEQ